IFKTKTKNNHMEKNPNILETTPEGTKRIIDQHEDRKSKNGLIIGLVTGLILTTVIIMFYLLSGPSDYEKGPQFIHQKQYSEALVEFQKVETEDKDFRMAQSKINYINGKKAFNDGLYPQAEVYLTKVEVSDEYYQESQLMIDKTKLAKRQNDFDSLSEKVNNGRKDTLIIMEKIAETSDKNTNNINNDNINQAVPKTKNDENANRLYISSLEKLINNYKILFTNAKDADLVSKGEKIKLMDSIYNETVKLDYTVSDRNAMVMELKNLTGLWMQKSITYLNSMNNDNKENADTSVGTTYKNKEEYEKQFTLMNNMLKKVKTYFSS
ncbi:MAG: hypothetical protein LH629_01410, partial [Ignavibacteria bacterium]|nr:hypothetical protein [Ignavibacteria bacterium]